MRGWLAVVVAACVIPQPVPQGPQPSSQDRAAEPAADPARAVAQQLAAHYDELFERVLAAEEHTSAHEDDQAADVYRDVVRRADRVLQELGSAPPDARFETHHDGALAAADFTANVKAVRAKAAQRADAAQDRLVEALAAELHVQTPGQRAVLRQHGRPEVAKQHGETCWVYRSDSQDEVFCWTAAGKISKHTTNPREVAADAPADPAPAPAPPPQPKKAKIAYYAAATFASGRCSFGNCLKDGWTTSTKDGDVETRCSFSDCAKDGWTSRHPDGSESETRCSFSDCFKDGWTTTHPDGTQSETRCGFGDCMKDGWTTTMPDGTQSETRCNFGDCMKDGWTTTLPSGKSVSCRCEFGDCLTNGASCD